MKGIGIYLAAAIWFAGAASPSFAQGQPADAVTQKLGIACTDEATAKQITERLLSRHLVKTESKISRIDIAASVASGRCYPMPAGTEIRILKDGKVFGVTTFITRGNPTRFYAPDWVVQEFGQTMLPNKDDVMTIIREGVSMTPDQAKKAEFCLSVMDEAVRLNERLVPMREAFFDMKGKQIKPKDMTKEEIEEYNRGLREYIEVKNELKTVVESHKASCEAK